MATSRNKAIKIAAGEYLQFVDADDYILENCCEELYKRCISLNLDMMTFSGYNFSSQNNKIENPYWNFNYIPKNWKRTWFTYKDCIDFLPEIHVSSCLTIYRRSLLLKNKILFPDGLCFEDNLFFTKAIFYAKRYSIHKGKFYARRIHSNAITQNWDKHFLDYIKVATLVINFLNEIKIQKQIIKNYKEKYISVINWCVKKYGSYLEKKYSKEINTFYNQE